MQAWTKPGPTEFYGKHYQMRYVNPWPLPLQTPHPPVWVPGSNSEETMYQVARRGFCYFVSTRSKLAGVKRSTMSAEVGPVQALDNIGPAAVATLTATNTATQPKAVP